MPNNPPQQPPTPPTPPEPPQESEDNKDLNEQSSTSSPQAPTTPLNPLHDSQNTNISKENPLNKSSDYVPSADHPPSKQVTIESPQDFNATTLSSDKSNSDDSKEEKPQFASTEDTSIKSQDSSTETPENNELSPASKAPTTPVPFMAEKSTDTFDDLNLDSGGVSQESEKETEKMNDSSTAGEPSSPLKQADGDRFGKESPLDLTKTSGTSESSEMQTQPDTEVESTQSTQPNGESKGSLPDADEDAKIHEKSPIPGLHKPGGEDAPDPFAPEFTKNTTAPAPTQPQTGAGAIESNATMPSDAAVSGPIAPPAFSQPSDTNSGGNRKRFVILLFGSILLFLLLGVLGVVMAKVLIFDDDDDVTVAVASVTPTAMPTATPTPTSSFGNNSDTIDPALVTIDLGPWTTPPPCLNYEDPDILDNDDDNDDLTTSEERHYGTDPCSDDTVGNGFKDGQSVKDGYDPLTGGMLDTDNDGIPDPIESALAIDPFDPDTDSDGYSDCKELANGYDPRIVSPDDKMSDQDVEEIEATYTAREWTLPDACPEAGN